MDLNLVYAFLFVILGQVNDLKKNPSGFMGLICFVGSIVCLIKFIAN